VTAYEAASQAQRRPTTGQLTDLATLCFGGYPGVLPPTADFMRWFLSRPGLDLSLSQAAWQDRQLAASAFITRASLLVEGNPVCFGLVDTVMTHPEHRRQGLAKRLVLEAIRACRDAGLEALQLYTAPDTVPYNLYRGLGFVHAHSLIYWRREAQVPVPGALPAWAALPVSRCGDLAELYETLAATHDGVPRHDRELWRWRKRERPAGLGATVWRARVAGSGAMATCSSLQLTDEGAYQLLSDVLPGNPSWLAALCARLDPTIPLVTVADAKDTELLSALEAAGFRPGQQEAALILSLRGESTIEHMQDAERPWMPLTESIIGV
jgi:GNAT superfamily N-acetyltransferase